MPGEGKLEPQAEDIHLTLDELCETCHVSTDFILELVEYGVLEPKKISTTIWNFNVQDLRLTRTAVHLHHDLEVNHAGIALAIDLMNQIETLQNRLEMLEKYAAMR